MFELWQALVQLFGAFLNLVAVLLAEFLYIALPLFWIMVSLFALNWAKLGPALRQGAAIPLVMLIFLIGAAWGGVAPSDLVLGGLRLPNFVWQTLAVAAGVGVTFLCGWLQLKAGWGPQEIELFPAAAHGHEDHHGHH